MNNNKFPTQAPFAFPLVIAKPPKPQPCFKTIDLLRSLLLLAESGKLNGIVLATLEADGAFRLDVEGEALKANNQMAVAGMLSALQKMVLELH